ncbi:MAG: ribonuclease HII [Candidatus Liptonbacteria bacterium]|nr:ribonuclease HII [Candidatus Liptonbacteria bacterium]
MQHKRTNGKYCIGIDEVGRGALAGPVLLVALAFPRSHPFRGIRDSKKLTPRGREEWLGRFRRDPRIVWASATSAPRTIDRMNIRRAADRAARRSYLRLTTRYPELASARVVLDGGLSLGPSIRHTAHVRGDERFRAIASASIVAKVRRDRLMNRLHLRYPRYAFDVHKGYGTAMHARALRRHGPSDVHRLTFIRNFTNLKPRN